MCVCLSSTRVLTSWTHPCFWQMAPLCLAQSIKWNRICQEEAPVRAEAVSVKKTGQD